MKRVRPGDARGRRRGARLAHRRRGRPALRRIPLRRHRAAALYASRIGEVPVSGPMESVANPAMRAYFERTRRKLGHRHPAARRRRERADCASPSRRGGRPGGRSRHQRRRIQGGALRRPGSAAARRGRADGRIAWQDLRGRHVAHRLGPLVGAPGPDRGPAEGLASRTLRFVLEQEARLLERMVARAPEQWWSLFFPIWEADATEGSRRAAPRARGPARPLARVRRRRRGRGNPRAGRGDRPGRRRHHRPRAHRRGAGGPAHRRAAGPPHPRDRWRGDHHPQRPPARAVPEAPHPAVGFDARQHRPRPRPGRHRDRGAPAGAVPAVRLRRHDPAAARRSRTRGASRRPSRPSTRRPPACTGRAASRRSWRRPGSRPSAAAMRTAPRSARW